jgi:hypothetical protein
MKMASQTMTHGGQFLLRTLVVLLLAFSVASGCFAQEDETETGTIKGTITSSKGGPISGARILITDRTTGKTVALRSDAVGAFASGDLAASDYTVRAEMRGFITASILATVKPGAPTTVDLQLGQEPLPGVVSAMELQNYPLRNRNFLELLQLEPGVQNQNAGTLAPTKNAYSSISLFSGLGNATPVAADGLSITDRLTGGVAQYRSSNSGHCSRRSTRSCMPRGRSM